MPRKPIARSREHFYHVTARSNNKEDFYIPKDLLWNQFVTLLRNLQVEYQLRIGAFVLMDNHFHLLLLSPNEDIDRVMYFLMKKLGLFIRRNSGRINKVFGNRYRGCLIQDETYLFNVYKYVYRNPVKAGISSKVEDYPYSSWHQTRVEMETLFFGDRKTAVELNWLNSALEQDQYEGIKRSLRRTVFHVPKEWKPEGLIYRPF